MRFAAAIFDLDGTLIDTERLVMEAGIEAFAALGHDLEPAFMLSLVGVAEDEGRRRIARRFGATLDLGALDDGWAAATRRRYGAGIPVKPGAAELLAATGFLPRGVATNSATASAERKLAVTGLVGHFGAIVGFDAVPLPKPAPDVFVEAARRLGARPQDCIAFEDSDTGVAAALAAGMTVVQVPDLQATGRAGAHHVATSLLDGARAAGLV